MLTVLIVIAALIAAALAGIAMKPNTFRISRSTVINAPAAAIYPHVADFHKWQGWSPWEELDPGMNRTFSGAESGAGAAYAWEGNKKVGSGHMLITAASPQNGVSLNLEFLRPMKASNVTEINFTAQGDATHVDWVMHGPQPFMSKLFGTFMNIDKMVGADFERGLAKLKAAAEG